MSRFVTGVAVLSVSLTLSLPISAQDSLDNLAAELVRMRGEVEQLNAELTSLSEQHRAEMNALAAQKGDLEATRRREDLRIRQLEQDLADNRERAAQAGLAGEALVPIAEDIISSLQAAIEQGLPFKTDDRLNALAEIQAQLESGAQAPPRIINRLWSFYEDELRLTRENGLYSQVIPLGGERVLADVAKLGTVAMYFQTRDGRMGQVARAGEGWTFVELESGEDRNQIETLFDSLKKQIRSGYFTLPNGTVALEPQS
ncbi:DUF3450 family protein [Wenzhouxiangella marina]|uniref:Uncharacterized protein n=1 Tax=Wenzhouxiangella marina TaxID=1579979 RepID=A0A0K0XX30_9GAMM|nr:DUF3450 family protein [Wenzhouxiangella marina]AKS42233.1 hypothetical protein WM2015_1866 [Wenzhouxiangella marina]MBB6085995.1 hypothetical protein [Wenzhouxiangella marina]